MDSILATAEFDKFFFSPGEVVTDDQPMTVVTDRPGEVRPQRASVGFQLCESETWEEAG